jgi:hypothetical protein
MFYFHNSVTVTGMGKVVSVHAMKYQRRNSTRSFIFTRGPLYSRKRIPLAYCTGGWVGLESRLDVWERIKSLVAAENRNRIV